MECQDVQQLLAFIDRKTEELDDSEREIVKLHLDKCPICAELAQSERRLDDTLGRVMREVPVPAGLQQKVMGKLNAERSRWPWKSGLAVAASLLLLVTGGFFWFERTHPTLKMADLESMKYRGTQDPAEIEQYFKQRGLTVRAPRVLLDYSFFQDADVVYIKGQPVAKLTFMCLNPSATADVLIVSPQQFQMKELQDGVGDQTAIFVYHEGGSVYVIFTRGNLEALRKAAPPA